MIQPNLTLDGHKLYFYYKIIGKPAKNLFNGTGEKICAQSVDFFSVWFLLEKLQHSKQKVKNVTAYLNIIMQPFRPTLNNNVSWRMQKQKTCSYRAFIELGKSLRNEVHSETCTCIDQS